MPSRATRAWVEQFGRVITGGQAGGAVVVGWASGSIPEIGGGLVPLAPGGDVPGLAGRMLELAADRERYADLRARGLARAVELAWPEVGHRQAAFYAQAACRPPRELRPDRAAAEREFGPPAQVAGGGRPFALTVLREDTPVSRALGRGLDALTRLRP